MASVSVKVLSASELPSKVRRAREGAHRLRPPAQVKFDAEGIWACLGDAMDLYASWETPTVIISDGPYGVKGFPGDPPTTETLASWYEPHIAMWTKFATPETTLWFWGIEIGWARVHHILERYGWSYRNAHTWDKGMAHAAGNSNTQSLRKFPPVTELCVQYVKDAKFLVGGSSVDMKTWLRHEWTRTGLPFSETNDACGVKNAATRKYFTEDHLWYYPPVEVFSRLVDYANQRGNPSGRPYFSIDGKRPVTQDEWRKMRAKFHCEMGVTNVWREPPLHGDERVKVGLKSVHLNQKPVRLMERVIRASSDEGDVVWDPFGGLLSGAVACASLRRKCFTAEMNGEFFELGLKRLKAELGKRRVRPLDSF